MDLDFPPKEGSGIEKLIPHAAPECVELICKLLAYNPDDRSAPPSPGSPARTMQTSLEDCQCGKGKESKQRTLEPFVSFVAFAFLTETFFPNSNGSCNTFIALDSFSSKGGFLIRAVCSLPVVHGRLGLPQPRRLVTVFVGDSAVLPLRAASCNGPLLFGLVRPETCVF